LRPFYQLIFHPDTANRPLIFFRHLRAATGKNVKYASSGFVVHRAKL